MMVNDDKLAALYNATVYGEGDEKIGEVGQVYVSDSDGTPSWVTAKTGLFGTKETFLPLADATIEGDRITVPYSKAYIKDAPNLEADAELSEAEEATLYEYYGVDQGAGRSGGGLGGVNGGRTGRGHDGDDKGRREDKNGPGMPGRDAGRGRDGDGDGDDETIVRHEERLKVGAQAKETGHARIRKHVRTEQQNVEVPVEREELKVERTPITDATPVADDLHDDGDENIDVTLHEERAVAEKETVPVEEITVDKRTVKDSETVSADLAREEIDVDADDARGTGRDGKGKDRDKR